MTYLLDTNVVSELSRPRPNPRVTSWLAAVPSQSIYVSVLTLGEIRFGILLTPDATRRERLRLWLENDLPRWFEGKLLPVTREVADRWGRLAAEARRPLARFDSLLAATALHHDLGLVTRNVRDFQFPGLEVINPWDIE
jgi:predicted nucleic acid-binding protein